MIELQVSPQSPLSAFVGRRVRLGDAIEHILKEKVQAAQKDWRERNKEKVQAAQKDWRERNPDYAREYYRQRMGL